MLFDARALPTDEILESDVCIVGAGAAGIALAREFAGMNLKVVLLESGGLTFSHRTQALYRGEAHGRNGTPLEFMRRRQFGGTTITWSGRCHPLAESDFEKRDWIPFSGWPLTQADLRPHYERANRLLELGEYRYDAGYWNALEQYNEPQNKMGIESKIFHFSPPTRFGETYRGELERAENIHVFLRANALHIQLKTNGNAVNLIRCATLQENFFSVKARFFILALGGLETPRLMLASRDVHPNGVGNQHDLLGRFFMDHVDFFDGMVLNAPEQLPRSFFKLDYSTPMRNLGMVRAIGTTEEIRREKKLLDACAFLVKRPAYKTDDRFFSTEMQGYMRVAETLTHARAPSLGAIKDLGNALYNSRAVLPVLWQMLTQQSRPSRYGVQIQLECAPNPESRATLSDERDALGMNRIRLDWKLTRHDLESYLRFRDLLFNGLEQMGFHTRRFKHGLDSEGWPVSLVAGKHHSGTTRMGRDERHSVVDGHCRVHGVNNLFIASSSVFPTAGMANPTLTILALALRVADEVKRRLQGEESGVR